MFKNNSTIIVTITIIVLLLAPVSVKAQIANDRENYYGDRLNISVDMPAKAADNPNICLPRGTSMVVIGQTDKNLTVRLNVKDGAPSCDSAHSPLSSSTAYTASFDDLRNSGAIRTGITYGALVVPFKYQLSGDKAFTGSASLGGYLGYRIESRELLGVTITPILFMGASNVSMQNSSKTGTDNVMGFSYGIGLIGTIKSVFQAGIVVGCDKVGNSVDYQYDGKPWIAMEIGFSFLQ